MAESKKPTRTEEPPMSNAELISHARRLTAELQRRKGAVVVMSAPNEPTQSEVCAALFDVAQATQKALIDNNCPGV